MASKPIQITIDEALLKQVDETAERLEVNRSAFIRDALRMALRQYRIKQLEEQQAAGYARHPVEPGEFDVWESEQLWEET